LSLPFRFLSKTVYKSLLLPSPISCYMIPITPSSCIQSLLRVTNYEVSRYSVFSNLLHFFSPNSIAQHPFFLNVRDHVAHAQTTIRKHPTSELFTYWKKHEQKLHFDRNYVIVFFNYLYQKLHIKHEMPWLIRQTRLKKCARSG
jgi:hypothetical protein